ncbi:hypothetical protein AOCH_001343 [Aspergillus ochraceoroseus]|uniref:ABC bile acid transporter n=1 Tax=Aspergillus ochraceoroseus TaxID=138278 RepID=A0A0F8TZA9_9EURO|nr:hypothetical protein AOCH_001343 [Aspergillus ochraceoroseus]
MSLRDLSYPSVGASIAGLTATTLVSIPHVRQLLLAYNQVEKRYQALDPNIDTEVIAKGKPPQSKWQRVTLVAVVGVATISALSSCILNTNKAPIPEFLRFVAWLLTLVQAIILISRRRSEDRYTLGVYSALGTLALSLSIALPYTVELHNRRRGLTLTASDARSILELVAALILLLVNLSLPRAGAGYRDGRVIDAQDSVSFLNRYTFSWAYKTLALAAKNGHLNTDDLPLVGDEVRARTLADAFPTASATSTGWKKWLKIYWRDIALQVTIQLFTNAFHFLPHFMLLTILRLFEERDAGANNQLQLWLTALSLGLSMVLVSWFISLRDFVADLKISLPINEQLFAVISRKAMGLKDVALPAAGDDEDEDDDDSDEEDDFPSGTKHSILNLLGVDVEKISDFVAYSYLLLDSILELSITVVFLTYLMGWRSTLAGCAIPFLLTPLYYYLTKRYSKREQGLMERRDEKSSALTEMVRGMRQIKFSALEHEWYSKIMRLRGKELDKQRDVFQLNVYLSAIWTFGPLSMSFLSITTHIYVNGAISASTAFTAISLFENLQNILSIFPEVLTDLLDASVSMRRIEDFLAFDEYEDGRILGETISLQNAAITWPSSTREESETQFQLKDLNLDLPSGKLTIISGRSGAGKTLLLRSLIGEAEVLSGKVAVPTAESASSLEANPQNWIVHGVIAYVAQDPWIENATIRDAILFGLPFNPTRYDQVVKACALTPDLQTFPDGDKTDIGSNGINLSGGQKWRLALARALYSRASILVFDDIFSAVDSHVGRHLYENALTGSLTEGRTRILATHHVRLCLQAASYLVKLENGNVLYAGHPDGRLPHSSSEGTLDDGNSDTSSLDSRLESRPRLERSSTHQSKSDSKANTFYEEETRARGVVKAKVYKFYLKSSGGYFHWALIIIFFILALLLHLAAPYWVSIWTRAYDDKSTPSALVDTSGHQVIILPRSKSGIQLDRRLVYYGSIYLGISSLSWVLDLLCTQIIVSGSIRASQVVFEQFTKTILTVPLHFLDTTPVGQILNRFTSDFGVLDSDLALDLSYLLHSCVMILGVIVAALVTSPVVVGLGALALLASWAVGYFYVTGAREAKRLESTARSPIFELVGSLLTGLPTIRAFGRGKDYIERMYDLIDTHCQALWHRRLFTCWMAFWLSMVAAVFVASVSMIFVSIRTIDAPLAGFALSFALEMSDHISWLLSHYAQVEIDFNAAERLVEYTQLEQESKSGIEVPASWPTKGEIQVTALYVGYAPDLPPVLNGLDFFIRQGERIGIVGRTGAGKSSLAMTLLRCLEARSGSIHIDGIDISHVRLHDLRSRLGLISQDPVVFAGTVREVLDPFSQHDDTELHNALEKVSLLSFSEDMAAGEPGKPTATNDVFSLSFLIAEGGKNLSQGQRQLLCLARALVSRPKILIMDEATASIDMESDLRIQRTLRQEIHGCTLLVIAHRLSTIADFDRIIVMDEGKVAEMDSPAALMQTEYGIFRGLVEQSGEREAIEKMIYGDR